MASDPSGTDLIQRGWNDFYPKPLEEKLPYFTEGDRLYDILFAQQFNRTLLNHLCHLADVIRDLFKVKEGAYFLSNLLFDKRAMLYFVQPSTRTFLSFINACHILGIKSSEIRDTSTSSELKGESPEDTIRTFSSYVDLIILRHHEKGFAEKTAWLLKQTNRPVPVINAGSGPDQHPTQAILDVYTMHKAFQDQGGLDGKTIVMVGDLKRGRTVRSLSHLMKNFHNMRIVYVSPQQLRMEKDVLDFLNAHSIHYEIQESMEEVLHDADAIYMTRIQDEYMKSANLTSESVDYSKYHFLPHHLNSMKEHAIIMHPLPRRAEIHTDVDNHPKAYYWRQERNGMWIRAALMAYMFKEDERILGFKP